MVGPVYGRASGSPPTRSPVSSPPSSLGGALSQYPVGWLADKFDRRWVLIWLSVAAMPACALTAWLAGMPTAGIMVAAALFGLTTFPIYSVSAAHAHDFADSHERVELSAALMFCYAVGAIAAPWAASVLIASLRPAGPLRADRRRATRCWWSSASTGCARAPRRPRTAYVYTPRTTFLIGRLLGRARDRH